MRINGIPVKFLMEHRNPKDIQWKKNGVRLVVECTGVFRDPAEPVDSSRGSLRGHLESGASKVILSAPFAIKNKSMKMPDDAITSIQGINDHAYKPDLHNIISAASCTTTCLSFMMKVLLEYFGAERILSASMVTVHETGTLEIPVTQVVIYGWYDNELGSFTNMLGERTFEIARGLA